MIEDIKEKCTELDALITMVLDEFQGIYNCEPKNRNYELERLRNAMTIALYMINSRNQDINSLTDKILEAEIQDKEDSN